MKRNLFLYLIVFLLLFFVTSCFEKNDYEVDEDSGPLFDDEMFDGESDGLILGDIDFSYKAIISSLVIGSMREEIGEYLNIQSGQITSTALNDLESFDLWKELIESEEQSDFVETYKNFIQQAQIMNLTNLLKVKLTSNGEVLENAKVELMYNDEVLYKAVSNAKGIVYLFLPTIVPEKFSVKVTYPGHDTQIFEDLVYPTDRYLELELENINLNEKCSVLDLALIVDTTGSMGDELEYLKVELKDVLDRFLERNIKINLALIFYRDEGDAYVTKVFDFTDDLLSQIDNLGQQISSGGGDYPEAVHEALEKADNLSWSDESIKIAIHVCDAPIHQGKELAFIKPVMGFAEKGVRLIPVICSGNDALCEIIFRIASMLTGGRYTYVTNHSGIGNNHSDANTKEETVIEYLNAMLVRLIDEFVSGVDIEPTPYYEGKVNIVKIFHNGDYFTSILTDIDKEITLAELLDLEKFDGTFYTYENDELVSIDGEFIISSNVELYFEGTIIIETIEDSPVIDEREPIDGVVE